MLVLRGARVIDPSCGLDEVADVVIEAGRISRVGRDAGKGLAGEQVRVLELAGRWVVPGFVDLHSHFREPGYEYKEDIASGLRAAAAGGFTGVCVMPNTKPVNDTRAITEMMMARGKAAAGPRLYPFAAATVGSAGEQLTEMGDLRDAGAIGVSDDGRCLMNAAVMRAALEYARTFDMLFSQHCEDHNLTAGAQMHEGHVSTRMGLQGWPRAGEDVIVARDLILAELTGARYHVAHVSSLGAVRLLREAKARGLSVSAEVTPHHLMLTHDALLGFDTACKVNPPLREPEDIAALREALRDGTIDCIATDHAPHSALEKECEFAAASPGMIGLEPAVPVLLDLVREGILSPMRLVEALSTKPARLGKLEGGTLKPGSAADIAVIDPERRWTINPASLASRSSNTPFLNKEVRGKAILTMVAGQIVYES
ncbi:MAG TPA: dihydroorotase [Polyangiales bacterium]